MTERRYLIVIEGAEGENYSAYAPDLPGCVATGATREEVEREMHDAIAFHLEGFGTSASRFPSRPTSPPRTSTSRPDTRVGRHACRAHNVPTYLRRTRFGRRSGTTLTAV